MIDELQIRIFVLDVTTDEPSLGDLIFQIVVNRVYEEVQYSYSGIFWNDSIT